MTSESNCLNSRFSKLQSQMFDCFYSPFTDATACIDCCWKHMRITEALAALFFIFLAILYEAHMPVANQSTAGMTGRKSKL